MISGTLLFVGCGEGLQDPNFGALLTWEKDILANCHHSHYILTQSDQVQHWRDQLRGVPVDPIPYGNNHSDLAPFLASLSQRVARKRVHEPISLLSRSQLDFESRWVELESMRPTLTAIEYFRRSRLLAHGLWQAGGRRRAAMAFGSRVSFESDALLIPEYVEFALEATDWFLQEDMPNLASQHLSLISTRLQGAEVPSAHLFRLRQLQIRCMDALCAYTKTLQAIEEALQAAQPDERARLQAGRSEIYLLQGEFDKALTDAIATS